MDVSSVSNTLPDRTPPASGQTEPRAKFTVDIALIKRLVPPRPPIPIDRAGETYKASPPEGGAPFAEIKDAEGKVLAQVFNSGLAIVPGDCKALDGFAPDLDGPALARARADKLAEALGATVSPAATAMTQEAWDALPVVWETWPAFSSAALVALQSDASRRS